MAGDCVPQCAMGARTLASVSVWHGDSAVYKSGWRNRRRALEFLTVALSSAEPGAPSVENALVFFLADFVFEDERCLRKRKKKEQRIDSPNFEIDPDIRREMSPDDLVGNGKCKREEAPSECQLAPTFFRQFECLTENVFDEETVHCQTAQQQHAEEGVEHRRLHLDEGVVLQIKREPAEHENEHC